MEELGVISANDIIEYYKEIEQEGNGDIWFCVTELINRNYTREKYPSDQEFYFIVSIVWKVCQEYVNSTYEDK